MITYFVAIATAILYAYWISKFDWPIWMRLFIGFIWGLIVVYSVMR